jgi:hypothetical protein
LNVDNQTSTAGGAFLTDPFVEPLKQLAVSVAFYIKVASTSVAETHRMVLQVTSSTSIASPSAVDTSLCVLAPAIAAQLDSILDGVRNEIIEDGMTNAISTKLPELVANHYRSVLPAIATLTDGKRTSAAVVAELLKELGRLRDGASHFDRRWILEHALSSRNPAARDGAGAGLAWLRDPAASAAIRAAADVEDIPQLKADLEAVFRLLVDGNDDGVAPQDHEA